MVGLGSTILAGHVFVVGVSLALISGADHLFVVGGSTFITGAGHILVVGGEGWGSTLTLDVGHVSVQLGGRVLH